MVRPGFGFMRDGASLGMLREMLVMIRIWGLLKPGCLPTFTATSDNQDSMQLLFRLLTKLWLCCKNSILSSLLSSLEHDIYCYSCSGISPYILMREMCLCQPGTMAPRRTRMRA